MVSACFPRFKFHVEHRPYFREATSILTGPPRGRDNDDIPNYAFNMINLFLDIESPGGVGWNLIRPNPTLCCFAADINKKGHTVALLQDGSRPETSNAFLGSWPRNAEHEQRSDPKKLFSFDTPFDICDAWMEDRQVRISHELNIAICFFKTATEAEVIGMKLSSNFDRASILFRLPRKDLDMPWGLPRGELLAVSSLHFALAKQAQVDLGVLDVDILDVRNGTILKTIQTPKCPSCPRDYHDEMALCMSMSEKSLLINWREHPTLLLRFS